MSTMQSDSASPRDESGIATWVVEATVAVILFALGALVVFKSWQLGAGWREDGPGAGYFPFYIGSLVCISSLIVAFGAFRRSGRDTKVFVTHEQLRRVLTVLLPSLAFVGAVQLIGIYLGAVLFIAGFMIWVGKYHWAKSIGIAFAVMALAYAMFEIWFKVPLFKGAFHLLSFLGH
jgi:Tripartite tricarboxylate transporter TctB family